MPKYTDPKPEVVCDTECYPNYWAIGFRTPDGRRVGIERLEDLELDRPRVARIFRKHTVFTFNGIGYDIPMILYAMTGATNAELKELNDTIIPPKGEDVPRLKPWEIMDRYGLTIPEWLDHVDLQQVAPSAAQRASLKKYAGMMHSKTMQDLPYGPNTVLTQKQMQHVRSYRGNDEDVTYELRDELRTQIELRKVISDRYGIDFRSKSDAQCGEAVMRHLVEERMPRDRHGRKPRIYKTEFKRGEKFKYIAPRYIKFETPYMQQVFSELLRSEFVINAKGYVEAPEMFGKKKSSGADDTVLLNDGETYEGGAKIYIGNGVYKMGIGGLHSQESQISHHDDEDLVICDNDVTSYYPWLMINSGHEPENMKGYFRTILREMVLERVEQKRLADDKSLSPEQRAKHKANAESLKIFVNGIFGKTGSPFSIVYAPRMMIQTTVTGQLSVLMLIERLTLAGYEVISANTDGFVTKVPKSRRAHFRAMIFDWECDTTLDTEETFYRSQHSRDVNSYVAIKYDQDKTGAFTGTFSVKRKGAYALSGRGQPAAMGLKKTPDVEICSDAMVAFLLDGTPVEETVRNCRDIRKFVTVRAVKGGGEKDGHLIGKVVRYYYATDNPGPITYVLSGNRVPSSEGAEPCMELPDEFPDNIDYAWYIREAYNILDDVGMDAPDFTLMGRTGYFFGGKYEQKTVHSVDARTGIAVCGAKRKDRRDTWLEFDNVPHTMRFCAKCRKATDL